MADNLQDNSLEWALTHITSFGDTDILPVPFEYLAIRHDWDRIRPQLAGIDLEGYRPNSKAPVEIGPHARFLVPKPSTGFRIVHQLDPLDALLYTAMVREVAQNVESTRVPVAQNVACSYRVNIDTQGRFFAEDRGWPTFQSQSAELAKEAKYVLLADIADFYNQLYQHRIENALETATVDVNRAKNIEGFLNKVSARHSRGVPVGPMASIILAEACLIDVDSLLITRGWSHTRYVDDFRVFGQSYEECLNALHSLTDYLYTGHRLCLQSSKTRIRLVETFIERDLKDPERLAEQGKIDKLQALIDQLRDITGYTFNLDDLADSDVNDAVRDSLKEVFQTFVGEEQISVGPIRYLLRRASSMRTRIIMRSLLENIEKLVPAFRDVAEYLIAVMPGDAKYRRPIGDRLLEFADRSPYGRLPFIRTWLLHIFTQCPNTIEDAKLLALCHDAEAQLGLRPRALAAKSLNDVAWVRSMKETWSNTSPRDQRAIVWAGSVLPDDEKKPWLNTVKSHHDLVVAAIATAVLAGVER